MKTPKDYYTDHMVPYEKPNSIGYLSLPVLEFLNGKLWDDIALSFVHSLHPTSIRVTHGTQTLDARVGRVTIIVDKDDFIKRITQEVEVGLPDYVQHGQHLLTILNTGKTSLQAQWEAIDGDESSYDLEFDGVRYSDTLKTLPDGRYVSYPKPGDKELVFKTREKKTYE
ncbi:MAG: hypothetical protein JRN15_14820 [Nitrososphaerota archaeon]|nr:hypothetical protein [Nitrososphaerota archaeon]